MHQYTSKGSIPGIKGNVDISECYFMEAGSAPVTQEPENQLQHIQPNYKPNQAYFVHVDNLRIRSTPSTDGKVIGHIGNRAVLNKATTRDAKGQIWMNISGTSKQEWVCADTGIKSLVY